MANLTPEEQLEVESDRLRRVNGAFRMGSEATPATPSPPWIGPFAAGVAAAIAIAVVMGIIALARLGH